MGYIEDALVDLNEKAVYLEISCEGWPTLTKLSQDELQALYTTLSASLISLGCPAQGMKADGDRLRLVIQFSVDRTVDEVLNALEIAWESCLANRGDYAEPEMCYIDSLSPHHVIDAVVQLHRPC